MSSTDTIFKILLEERGLTEKDLKPIETKNDFIKSIDLNYNYKKIG